MSIILPFHHEHQVRHVAILCAQLVQDGILFTAQVHANEVTIVFSGGY